MNYDFIGDVHGHASKLKLLLEEMGYRKVGGIYQHPDRKAFFLGDIIDNGPEIAEVVEIVISMVEAGTAKIIMGNHEFNFLAYNTKRRGSDEYLRPQDKDNTKQCIKTLEQLSPEQKERLLAFIWKIPLWHEEEEFQAIHACWSTEELELLKKMVPGKLLTEDFLQEAATKKSLAYETVEVLLKGKEVEIPEPLHFHDRYKKLRKNARVCWWNEERKIVIPGELSPDLVEEHKASIPVPLVRVNKPTFFGHYWEVGTPTIVNPKAVCLDYSVARGHHLCAYRFRGEEKLKTENLVYV